VANFLVSGRGRKVFKYREDKAFMRNKLARPNKEEVLSALVKLSSKEEDAAVFYSSGLVGVEVLCESPENVSLSY